jgi:hypothetical protein
MKSGQASLTFELDPDKYSLTGNILGHGSYGVVVMALNRTDNDNIVIINYI